MKAIGTIIVVGLLAITLAIIKAAWQHGHRPMPTKLQARASHGPDISHCFSEEEERELWDCIRHED